MNRYRIFYAVTLVFLAALYLVLGGEMLLTFLAAFLILPILSLISLWFSWRKCLVTQRLIPSQKHGEATLQISVEGRGFYPIVQLEYYPDMELVSSGGSRETLTLWSRWKACIPLAYPYRGQYQVGLRQAAFCDFLGLFCFRIHWNAPLLFKVYPRPVSFPSLPDQYVQEGESTTLLSQPDPTLFSNLRSYHPKDNMRSIHWKASAKLQEWMVKEYEGLGAEGATLLLNAAPHPQYPTRIRAELEDRMTGFCIAAVQELSGRGIPLQLLYADGTETVQHISTSVPDLVDTVSFLPFEARQPIEQLFISVAQRQSQKTILLFTHDMDQKFCETIVRYASPQQTVILFYCSVSSDPQLQAKQYGMDYLERQGILCFSAAESPQHRKGEQR